MVSSRSLKCICLVVAATVLPAAVAKDREMAMPFYVLQAQTVAVMIAPDAAVSLLDPDANKTAQKDVEAALSKWGRFKTVLNPVDADIVIVLRKGTSKATDVTVKDPRQNSRPGSYTDGDIAIGAHHGSPSPPMAQGQHGYNIPPGNPLPAHPETNAGEPSPDPSSRQDTNPQVETGTRDDAFAVYRGHTDEPTTSEPSWMYVRKNALHSHDVPAVDQFRKAMEEAAKKIEDAGKKQQKP